MKNSVKKMIFFICVLLSFCLSLYKRSNIGLGISIAIVLAYIYGILQKYTQNELIDAGWKNGKKSLLVIKIFILVGAISSMWIMSGTIPGIVYYGIKFMDPKFYYVSTFIITSFVSFLIGSSFGTVSTIGIALIAVGRGLGIDVGIAGGAIIAGAYFGDRCSPVSSSASLVATLTETDLYTNIKNMFKTSVVAFVVSCILYVLVSNSNIGLDRPNILSNEITETFNIGWPIFMPVVVILLCALFKVNVKISMGLSIVVAGATALFYQKYDLLSTVKDMFLGFTLDKDNALRNIMKGGGVISMWKSAYIVFISCYMSGILDHIRLLDPIKKIIIRYKSRWGLFLSMICVSIVASMLGCNQSIATVMTADIMKNIYGQKNISNSDLALDIENTAIVIAPLIPWNIAGMIPATAMMDLGTVRYIPYSFYLYLLPLYILFIYIAKNKRRRII